MFNNDRRRTPLDHSYKRDGLRFKVIFPDFNTWKNNLIANGIKESDIKESEFNILSGMIGNSYLRYNTDNKNISFISLEFRRLNAIKTRNLTLYNLDTNSMLETISKTTQKFYLVNRSDTGQLELKYLDSGQETETINQDPVITHIEEIREQLAMNDPEIIFLTSLAISIVKPLQPNETLKKEF